jgi:hypothetical protein
VRVEHNRDTLLVHISGEDGHGWTTVAIDRATREWSIAQRRRQMDAAKAAYANLYAAGDPEPGAPGARGKRRPATSDEAGQGDVSHGDA